MVFTHSSSGRNIRETSGAEDGTVRDTSSTEDRVMDRKSVWIDGRQIYILPWAKVWDALLSAPESESGSTRFFEGGQVPGELPHSIPQQYIMSSE